MIVEGTTQRRPRVKNSPKWTLLGFHLDFLTDNNMIVRVEKVG